MADSCKPGEVALKEWTKLLVDGVQRDLDLRFRAAEDAVKIASTALSIRLDHANGLIAQMKEQNQEFPRSREVNIAFDGIRDRIAALERFHAANEGQQKGGERLNQVVMLIVGAAISLGATVLALKLGAK